MLLRVRRYFYMGIQPAELPEARVLLDLARDSRARYLLLTMNDFDLDFFPALVHQEVGRVLAERPQAFALVYETPTPFARIYQIEPGGLD